jgi:opacity protein-like surface antigen
MNKRIVALAFGAAAAMSITSAQAQDSSGLYLRLDSGWSFSRDAGGEFEDDVGGSYILGAGLGYRFSPNLRGDITATYRGGYDVDFTNRVILFPVTAQAKADVSSIAGLVNVYYDIGKFGLFTPYVGGGIGLSRNKIDDVSAIAPGGVTAQIDGDEKISLAWQLSAGTAIEIRPGVSFDIGYRYIDLGKVETADTGNLLGVIPVTGVRAAGELKAHEIQVGFRWAL